MLSITEFLVKNHTSEKISNETKVQIGCSEDALVAYNLKNAKEKFNKIVDNGLNKEFLSSLLNTLNQEELKNLKKIEINNPYNLKWPDSMFLMFTWDKQIQIDDAKKRIRNIIMHIKNYDDVVVCRKKQRPYLIAFNFNDSYKLGITKKTNKLGIELYSSLLKTPELS